MQQVTINKKIISASILSADLANLGQEVTQAIQAGVDWIHVDVMDHHFVPNLTFGPTICLALRNYGIKAIIDAHLMVTKADSIIIDFVKAGADIITIHPESTNNIINSLKLIKDNGCKAGIALKPDTNIDILTPLINQIDLILIMSVYPGFAGQKFIDSTFNKIKLIKNLLKNTKQNILLSVDGGVNLHNIQLLSQAGINVFVAGSTIFKAHDKKTGYKNIVANMLNLI